ncbi:MAG: hypothetical protein LBT76_06910, partial [Tannerella sp.]|nr:hypothetical protein [Tannerella sp.]
LFASTEYLKRYFEYLFTSTKYLWRYSIEGFWYYGDVFGDSFPVQTFRNRLERGINPAPTGTDERFG